MIKFKPGDKVKLKKEYSRIASEYKGINTVSIDEFAGEHKVYGDFPMYIPATSEYFELANPIWLKQNK